MAQFYGKIQGQRGEATRLGSKTSGLRTTAASWEGAVRVRLDHIDGAWDEARISLATWHGAGNDVRLYAGPVGRFAPTGGVCKALTDALLSLYSFAIGADLPALDARLVAARKILSAAGHKFWLPGGEREILTATQPWDDCKVAFGVDDAEVVWAAEAAGALTLPRGWSLCETDSAGARCVAVFRVEGYPNPVDGERVRQVLQDLG